MNKQVYEAVTKRSNGYCEAYNCSRYIGEGGELHHSIGGVGKRQQHESLETCFKLCDEHHKAVDKDIYTRLYFQLVAQINLMKKYITDEHLEIVRQNLGGKLYA